MHDSDESRRGRTQTAEVVALGVMRTATRHDDDEGVALGDDGGGVRGGVEDDVHARDAAETCTAGGGGDTRLLWSHLTEDSCTAGTSPKSP